ncbi:MAG TPA: TlpA disulfide reductase family protein [Candidatus Polarisedimenticolaceae bacterium]|nr:TlpA disulfide reductase family protein [Candidatus Polarisedimenticolaceae bacterium]
MIPVGALALLLSGTIVARTGPPRFSEVYHPIQLRPTAAADRLEIKRRPKGIDATGLFGFVPFGGLLRVCIIDGDPQQGYRLFIDWNANRDLTDDRSFAMRQEAGHWVALLNQPPSTAKLEYERERPQPLRLYALVERSGVLDLGRSTPFAVVGSEGSFDGAHDRVCFDLDGDGGVDTRPWGAECIEVGTRSVRLDGSSYAFRVARDGTSVTLKPAKNPAAELAVLGVGSPAPDFTFTTLDGTAHELREYRGRVVLLDFWGTWCGPCRGATPRLLELYREFAPRGFEILGFDVDDSAGTLRDYTRTHGIGWPQSLQERDGPVLKLYRVRAYPSYFLIDRDGTIAGTGLDTSELASKLAELLEP